MVAAGPRLNYGRGCIWSALIKSFRNFLGGTTVRPPKFWSYIKSSSFRAEDGMTYTDSKSKADILNKQFASVFSNRTDELNNGTLPDLGLKITDDLKSINIDPKGVLRVLKSLNANKSPGPDEIFAHLLKKRAESTAPILSRIYQASINQGSVPCDWTMANVTPFFKKGDISNAGNYRQISLTCVAIKVLEHNACSKFMDHLEKCNLLSNAQHDLQKAQFL